MEAELPELNEDESNDVDDVEGEGEDGLDLNADEVVQDTTSDQGQEGEGQGDGQPTDVGQLVAGQLGRSENISARRAEGRMGSISTAGDTEGAAGNTGGATDAALLRSITHGGESIHLTAEGGEVVFNRVGERRGRGQRQRSPVRYEAHTITTGQYSIEGEDGNSYTFNRYQLEGEVIAHLRDHPNEDTMEIRRDGQVIARVPIREISSTRAQALGIPPTGTSFSDAGVLEIDGLVRRCRAQAITPGAHVLGEGFRRTGIVPAGIFA